MNDVIVVGGGPAGLYAAGRMAREGIDVRVIEEHPCAGRPVHCTGILASEVFDEFALARSCVLNELRTVRFFSPSGQSFTYSGGKQEVVVVDRFLLDQHLCQAARSAGAEITFKTRVTRVQVHRGHVDVFCAGETNPVRARSCILAAGADYRIQRVLGLGNPPLFLNAAQAELPIPMFGDVEVHFGTQIAPGGFGWVVPIRRNEHCLARVGLMCKGDAFRHFGDFLRRLQPTLGIGDTSSIVPRLRILPLSPLNKSYMDRLLVIGDAAGLAKPTTGGGIYYGLISASIAADVLTGALRLDRLEAEALSPYEKLWKERIMEDIDAQLTLRLLAQRLRDEDIESFVDLAKTDGLLPMIRRTAKLNRQRDMIVALLRFASTGKILFRKLSGQK